MNRRLTSPAVAVLLAVVLAACGASAREKALQTTYAGLNAARDGFIAWDHEHQLSIVHAATDPTKGLEEIRNYQRKREVVVLAFESAYKMLAAAAIAPSEIDLDTVLATAIEVYDALERLTGRVWRPGKSKLEEAH